MAYVAFSRSPIHVRETGGDVDPGFGQDRPPVDPGYGRPEIEGPIDPGFGVPLPPVDPGFDRPVLPPHIGGGPAGRPPHIGGGPARPTYPVDPGFGIPTPPTTWPIPPRPLRPDNSLPPAPVHPSLPIYLPGVDNELPLPPGAVWPPLPPALGATELLCFVWIVGIGYRWTVIDTSLKPSAPLPPTTVPPDQVDNTLPPTPAPKA